MRLGVGGLLLILSVIFLILGYGMVALILAIVALVTALV